MVTFQDFNHRPMIKSLNHLAQHNKQHHRKVLLSSFHLNGRTKGFTVSVVERFAVGGRLKSLYTSGTSTERNSGTQIQLVFRSPSVRCLQHNLLRHPYATLVCNQHWSVVYVQQRRDVLTLILVCVRLKESSLSNIKTTRVSY